MARGSETAGVGPRGSVYHRWEGIQCGVVRAGLNNGIIYEQYFFTIGSTGLLGL